GKICDPTTLVCRDGCRDDSTCGGGKICEPSTLVCRAGCRKDVDCGAGEICDNAGTAATFTCGAGCRDDKGCGTGFVCDKLKCVTGCRATDPTKGCNVGMYCEAGGSTDPTVIGKCEDALGVGA